jgi:microcystin-dependent protein
MATYRPLIVNSTANQIQELASGDSLIGITTVTASTFVGNGTIPVGGIIMWSGTIANIPTGWALCNGSNSTPDLRNRFIVGATSDASAGVTFNADTGTVSGAYAPGNTGGETAHKLTIAELASHNHNITLPLGSKWDLQGSDLDVPNFNNTQYTSDSTGGDKYHENRPPYYALAFIMRTL